MRSRIVYVLGAAAFLLAVVGAFFIPRRDLRSMGQVAGIALDREGDGIRATFELYVSGTDDPIGFKSRVITAEGQTLEECLERATLTWGDSLFANDALVLILNDDHRDFLLNKVFEHYRLLKNDRMDLPVVFVTGQQAGAIFADGEEVLSMELSASLKYNRKRQTVKDLMNGKKQSVMIKGAGNYEILS